MIDTTLTGVVLIALAVQLFKSVIEAAGITNDRALHDPLIWLTAFAVGITGYVLNAAIGTPLTPALARDAAGQGITAALGAVGSYHLVTHPFFGEITAAWATKRASGDDPPPPAS